MGKGIGIQYLGRMTLFLKLNIINVTNEVLYVNLLLKPAFYLERYFCYYGDYYIKLSTGRKLRFQGGGGCRISLGGVPHIITPPTLSCSVACAGASEGQ
jgi:hypothetical protein